MLLDESILLQSCGGDEEFARELFGEYHQRVSELRVSMREAYASQQIEEIRKAAHELKGSSLTLGAAEMAQISRTIEDGCKSGQVDSLGDWLKNLEEQSQLLFDHLRIKGYL